MLLQPIISYRQQNKHMVQLIHQYKTQTPATKDDTKVCYYSVFDMSLTNQLSADTMQKPL